jgi:ethanolamine ammonia-lyase small subunit
MPSGAIEAVPTHLLASARFAATNHEQATGESITPGELAARISVPTTTAANLLRALHSETPARLNGYAHGTVQ